MAEVKPGIETSEHKAAQSSKVWGIVAMILGIVIALGGKAMGIVDEGSNLHIIMGSLIAMAGNAQQTLSALGYIASRTKIKEAAEGK